MIVGIDEVGRGPWAGPLVVGAVVLGGQTIEGLTDSKRLSKKRREELAREIHEKAAGVGLGWVEALEIDVIGLSEALRLATRRALEQIHTPYHEIIIDGTINFLAGTNKEKFVTTLKKADLLVPSVSAASIVAKVARDAFMAEQDKFYEGYSFKSHVGYGTAAHRVAIEKLGVTPLHRLSFAPLANYRTQTLQGATSLRRESAKVTTKSIGDRAEEIVAAYLCKNGHEIMERNWKTKFCEIDIVSKKDDTIFFTEVKYRKQTEQGGGLAAITAKKHRQMRFAAELYTSKHQNASSNLQLAVASVATGNFELQDWFIIE